MRHIMLGLAILIAPALLATSCKRPEEKQREVAREINKEKKEHAEKMSDLQKDAFLANANRELERIDRNLDALKNRADKLTGEEKDRVNGQIKVMENKYDALKKDIDDAKNKTDAEFSELREGFETGIKDLQKSYDELAAKVG